MDHPVLGITPGEILILKIVHMLVIVMAVMLTRIIAAIIHHHLPHQIHPTMDIMVVNTHPMETVMRALESILLIVYPPRQMDI